MQIVSSDKVNNVDTVKPVLSKHLRESQKLVA